MNSRDVTIAGPGGIEFPAVLIKPDMMRDDESRPGVVVLHEIFGINDDMRRIAGRFADHGYVALVPDFLGDGLRLFCILRAMSALKRERGRPFEQLRAARAWFADQSCVDAQRIGVVGFCMGGGFAVLYAAQAPVAVVGAYYGDVPTNAQSLRGVPPVVGGFGGRDKLFAPGAKRLEAHLESLGVAHDICTYAQAGHSYMSQHSGVVASLGRLGPMKVQYNEAAAEDSWSRMLAFFDKYLEPPPEN